MSCFSSTFFIPAIGSSRSSSSGSAASAAAELDALLQAVRQPPHRRLAQRAWISRKSMTASDLLRCFELLAPCRAQVQGLFEGRSPHLEIATGHEVVEHVMPRIERDVLEGPGDAQLFAASYGSTLRRLPALNATLPAAGGTRR